MKRCIDCDYKFTCGKANARVVCDKYKKTPKTYTRLEKKDGDSYKFLKMEDQDDSI